MGMLLDDFPNIVLWWVNANSNAYQIGTPFVYFYAFWAGMSVRSGVPLKKAEWN